jgi:SnoaL-like protein
VSDSPIEALLDAFDKLDVDGIVAMSAPEVRVRTADGRAAEGKEAVRRLLATLVSELRSMSHRIVAEWHVDDVWIAEVEASYEMQDWLRLNGLPRAYVVHEGPDGIREVHAYGAHERPLTDHRTGDEGMWIGERWIPPL